MQFLVQVQLKTPDNFLYFISTTDWLYSGLPAELHVRHRELGQLFDKTRSSSWEVSRSLVRLLTKRNNFSIGLFFM